MSDSPERPAKEPDWELHRAVHRELAELADAGRLTRAEFDRRYEIGTAALNGWPFAGSPIMVGIEHGIITEGDIEGGGG